MLLVLQFCGDNLRGVGDGRLKSSKQRNEKKSREHDETK